MTHKHILWILLGLFTLILLTQKLLLNDVTTLDPAVQSKAQDSNTITITASIDARNITRGMIHSNISIPVQAGPLSLWVPKWIPGIHAPRGAIQNVAGLQIYSDDNSILAWQRDPHDMFAFHTQIPNGCSAITVQFDYICNQPSTNSIGVDSYGDKNHGVMSWNNMLVYPDGFANDQITIEAQIQVPEEWKLFSALPHHTTGTLYQFSPSLLRTVIDSPMICGKNSASHQLNSDGKDVFLHCVGSTEHSIACPASVVDGMRNLVSEARALFGHEHYEDYHFLLACSNNFPHLGLEHLSSSLNGVNATDLPTGAYGATRVMAHEYVHSWCGKYRRPLGMFSNSYHFKKDTTLLWIYEGLTQYLGNVLSVRAHLRNEDDFHDVIRYYVSSLRNSNGRRWRSLADTARSSYLLRGGSENWPNWVRGQDYYIEGALIWLEVDSIIRSHSKQQRSLDDFCKLFLGNSSKVKDVNPYSYNDVLRLLNDIHPYDWANFFKQRVYQTQDAFNTDFLEQCGWRITCAETPDAEGADTHYYYRNAYESIGAGFNQSGRIYRVLKDSPAYQAGLARGMRVVKLNGHDFSPAHLHQALLDAKASGTVNLKIDSGDEIRDYALPYAEGPRYLVLERLSNSPDLLQQIIAPLHKQKIQTGQE